jgi:hypothetical protein
LFPVKVAALLPILMLAVVELLGRTGCLFILSC